MHCESTAHRVPRIDRNHYFSSRLQVFYCAQMSQFLEVVGSNGLPQHTQFPHALGSISRFGKFCCHVAFRKIHCLPNCYQFRTSFLTYVPGGAPYPLGHSLPLLCSAPFLTLALVHVLSVALLRPVSSILLSFPGDASPSVGLLALRSRLLKFFRGSALQLEKILRILR